MGAFKVKVKGFERFAQRHGISDADLLKAAESVIAGNFDADLGGGVYKQRVAVWGARRGGAWQ